MPEEVDATAPFPLEMERVPNGKGSTLMIPGHQKIRGITCGVALTLGSKLCRPEAWHDLGHPKKETHDTTIDQVLDLLKETFGELLACNPLEQPNPMPKQRSTLAAVLPAPVPLSPVGPMGQDDCRMPELTVKFIREARQLGNFLTEVWNFMVHYGLNFPDNKARVSCSRK